MLRPLPARPALGMIGAVIVPLAARGPIVRRQRVSDWLEHEAGVRRQR
jgi:hypothetical protein